MVRPELPRKPSIVFGVTSSESLKLLGKIPEKMASEGWRVHLVTGSSIIPGAEMTSDVEVCRIPMVRRPSAARDLVSLVKWVFFLARLRPDVVSVGTPKAAFLGIVAAWICRVPSRIYVLRGLRLETTQGFSRGIQWCAEFLTSQGSTKVLSVSPSLRLRYLSLKLARTSKALVLGKGSSHGVDTEHFNLREKSTSSEGLELDVLPGIPVLGFVGRFSEDKGSKVLVAIRKSLINAGVDHYCLVIGPVENAWQDFKDLNSLARPVIAPRSVVDTAPFYKAMDMLILPTLREGFPNVILEAAATGIPAITSDATGAIDSIVNGVTGITVRTGDGDGFARAVQYLISNPNLRHQLGLNARNWVMENFEESDLVEKHVDFYRKQLK